VPVPCRAFRLSIPAAGPPTIFDAGFEIARCNSFYVDRFGVQLWTFKSSEIISKYFKNPTEKSFRLK
jgi:hypothetical protein